MANCIIEEQNLYNIANAIRNKNGESSLYKPSQMAGKISDLESAESVNPNNPVIIYDYDGSIIHSYSKADFLNLTEYPTPPTHEDITFDEYNWSLSDAKSYLSTHDNLYIGAIYKTTNKETILYLNTIKGLTLKISFYLMGSATVEWMDGTTTSLSGQNVLVTATKTDLEGGLYKVKIKPDSDSSFINLTGSSNGGILVQSDDTSKTYIYSLYKIVLGKVSISGSALRKFGGLENIILTNDASFNSGATDMFRDTYSLKHVNFPKSFTETCSSMFTNSNVKTICFPSTLTTVVGTTFSNTRIKTIILPNATNTLYLDSFSNLTYLETIELPDNVNNLVQSLFTNCISLKKVKLPTMTTYVANYTNLFAGCSCLKEVVIPEQYTEICNYMFSSCYSLSYVKIPKNVTAFGTNFMSLSNIHTIDCSELLQVPTLADTNVGYNTNFIVIVPDSLYSSWIASTNWSDISSHIVRVSDL